KLATAAAAAGLYSSFERNIEALKAVQPADLEPGDIEARLGSSWIPASDISAFAAELLDIAPRNVRVGHAAAIATWTVEIDAGPKRTGVRHQEETIAAGEKQQQLKDRFREWIWEDGVRAARLAREYNDRFNNLRLRTFDGSHLTLPGMNRAYLRDGDLSRHQK